MAVIDTGRYGRRQKQASDALNFQMGSAQDLGAAVAAINADLEAKRIEREKARRLEAKDAVDADERNYERGRDAKADERQDAQDAMLAEDRAVLSDSRRVQSDARREEGKRKASEEVRKRQIGEAAGLQAGRGFVTRSQLSEIGNPDELLGELDKINQSAFDRETKFKRESAESDAKIAKDEALTRKAGRGPSPAAMERLAKKDKLLDLQIKTAEGNLAPDVAPLRREFNALPATKQFQDIEVSFSKMQDAAANPSAAGDLSLIFSFMKMLDPGSTVREGEFATAQNATSVPEQIRNEFNKILSGQRLGTDQRDDFMRSAKAFRDSHRKSFESEAARYEALARRAGGSPQDVTGRTSIEDDAAELGIILE